MVLGLQAGPMQGIVTELELSSCLARWGREVHSCLYVDPAQPKLIIRTDVAPTGDVYVPYIM